MIKDGWNSPPDCSDAVTILGLPGKISNANTEDHNESCGLFLYIHIPNNGWNSPPDYSYAVTILGLPGKISNANTRNLNRKVEVFSAFKCPPDTC